MILFILSWTGEIRTPIAVATDLQSADFTHLPSIQFAESKGIEPSSRRMARFSRPLKHHCLLLSIFEVMNGLEPSTFRVATLYLGPLGHITICGRQGNRTLTAFTRNNLAGCLNKPIFDYLPFVEFIGVEPTSQGLHSCAKPPQLKFHKKTPTLESEGLSILKYNYLIDLPLEWETKRITIWHLLFHAANIDIYF